MAKPNHPYVFTMWWGELEDFQMVVVEAPDWKQALKEMPAAAGMKKLPAEYEVISAILVKPDGLVTELVNAYFEAGEKPQYAEHVDTEDEAAAGLWRKPAWPKGPLNQYMITGTITEDDLRFTQNLNDPSLRAALKTVEAYFKKEYKGADPNLNFYSAVELTHDGTVNVWWLRGDTPLLHYTFPITGGPAAGKKKVKEALAKINRHRARIGQRPLDPAAAGWEDADVLEEARQLKERGHINPVEEIKAKLLAW
jgi:hypothetical protein